MKNQGFDLLGICKVIERMMTAWYSSTREKLQRSGDLNIVQQHFVDQILSNLLPKSVIIGKGEIVDSEGNRSGRQDVIIYRANFPVITNLTPVNTYLAEGVIATIEVKSDLSFGVPNHLRSAFKRIHRVQRMTRKVQIIKGHQEQVGQIMAITSPKSYVIGYAGWNKKESLLDHYKMAVLESNLSVPDIVCQPGFCIIRNDGFLHPVDSRTAEILIHQEYPIAVFLHHLLKAVLMNTGGSTVTIPGNDAIWGYDLDSYFNFGKELDFKKISLESL